jgi:hypothetical protein
VERMMQMTGPKKAQVGSLLPSWPFSLSPWSSEAENPFSSCPTEDQGAFLSPEIPVNLPEVLSDPGPPQLAFLALEWSQTNWDMGRHDEHSSVPFENFLGLSVRSSRIFWWSWRF